LRRNVELVEAVRMPVTVRSDGLPYREIK
jgi:hypothetical protein